MAIQFSKIEIFFLQYYFVSCIYFNSRSYACAYRNLYRSIFDPGILSSSQCQSDSDWL